MRVCASEFKSDLRGPSILRSVSYAYGDIILLRRRKQREGGRYTREKGAGVRKELMLGDKSGVQEDAPSPREVHATVEQQHPSYAVRLFSLPMSPVCRTAAHHEPSTTERGVDNDGIDYVGNNWLKPEQRYFRGRQHESLFLGRT